MHAALDAIPEEGLAHHDRCLRAALCLTMLLGFVTSVVNLNRQEIHLNSARRSTVPDTEKGTPCAKAPSLILRQ